jgi:23S rRNA (cytosine1962-C5)-methyltransferase
VWRPRLDAREWQKADASFERFSGGDGKWQTKTRLPESWKIGFEGMGQMVIRLTDFGHLGIFPEQHANWQKLTTMIAARQRPGSDFNVLNLFAYTGGSSLAAARGGAKVAHVDASKTSVAWARENAEASGLADKPVRWLVDDVQKFVARELRRSSRYHGIILDPPSYGRGPGGETWKIEEHMVPLLDQLKQLLADDFCFVLLSSHSAGYTPLSLQNLLATIAPKDGNVSYEAAEMTVLDAGGRPLPSGASCYMLRG